MKVAVWDTYVTKEDGSIMNFDILVPKDFIDEAKIFEFGKEYLSKKAFKTGKLTAEECRLCHIEVAPDNVIADIERVGYSIIELKNCD